MIQGEKALDAEMAAGQDLFVKVGTKCLEIVETVRHGSSGWNCATPLGCSCRWHTRFLRKHQK